MCWFTAYLRLQNIVNVLHHMSMISHKENVIDCSIHTSLNCRETDLSVWQSYLMGKTARMSARTYETGKRVDALGHIRDRQLSVSTICQHCLLLRDINHWLMWPMQREYNPESSVIAPGFEPWNHANEQSEEFVPHQSSVRQVIWAHCGWILMRENICKTWRLQEISIFHPELWENEMMTAVCNVLNTEKIERNCQ